MAVDNNHLAKWERGEGGLNHAKHAMTQILVVYLIFSKGITVARCLS